MQTKGSICGMSMTKTLDMTSDENDKILYKEDNQSELETDQNHTYMEILAFGLDNTPYLSSTN